MSEGAQFIEARIEAGVRCDMLMREKVVWVIRVGLIGRRDRGMKND